MTARGSFDTEGTSHLAKCWAELFQRCVYRGERRIHGRVLLFQCNNHVKLRAQEIVCQDLLGDAQI